MGKTHQLILKNDNKNDFMYVIACLMRSCDHDRDQAEQCAIITHNVGKCQIKVGDFLEVMEIQELLNELNLNVEIQKYEGDLYKF